MQDCIIVDGRITRTIVHHDKTFNARSMEFHRNEGDHALMCKAASIKAPGECYCFVDNNLKDDSRVRLLNPPLSSSLSSQSQRVDATIPARA